MKFVRGIFYLTLFLYLLFPRDDGLKIVGIGPEGSRVLLLDILLLLMLIGSLSVYFRSFKGVKNKTGLFPLLLFGGATLFSLVRGIPVYGGYAIGEARWYLLSVMMPVGYAIYDSNTLKTTKRLFYIAALWHSAIILFNLYSGSSWDTRGDVLRFAGGRESLVIGLTCVMLIDDIISAAAVSKKSILPWIGLILFSFVLLVGQTRSIFLFLPIVLIIYFAFLGRLKLLNLVKLATVGALFIVVIGAGAVYVLPEGVSRSISSSWDVVSEALSVNTYRAVIDPSLLGSGVNSDFSRSGNTLFRVLAWSQVITNIGEVPGGWFIGMPMGAGFEFYEPSGTLDINLDPHNDYISILSKIGLIGLAGYFLILWSYARNVWQERQAQLPILKRTDFILVFAIVCMLALFVSLNAEIRTYGLHFWIWFFLGFGFKSLLISSNPKV